LKAITKELDTQSTSKESTGYLNFANAINLVLFGAPNMALSTFHVFSKVEHIAVFHIVLAAFLSFNVAFMLTLYVKYTTGWKMR
jgi:hypothetical protein